MPTSSSTSTTLDQASSEVKDQTVTSRGHGLFKAAEFVPAAEEINQFDYRPMPIIVPVAFVLSLFSAVAFFGVIGITIALAATFVSLYAWRVVATSEGTMSGKPLAIVSLLLSVLFFGWGTSSEIHAYQTEVPEGYKRVSFASDISAKGFVFENGRSDLHPEIKPLVDKPLFLKGYIYPPSDPRNMKEFLLLKDTGECCFGGKPAQTDMILVKIKGNKGLNYREGLQRMSVAGVFKFDMATYGDGLLPVYQMEVEKAEFVEPSRTSF